MTDNFYCTVSEQSQARLVIERMRVLGYQPEDVIVVDRPEELERFVRTESDVKRSTILGGVYGFLFGVLISVATLLYMGRGMWDLVGVPLLLGLNGLGWGLVGTIVGCGGHLVSGKVPPGVEHQLDKKVGDTKLVITFPVQNREKLSTIHALLKEVGATNIYCKGDA